MTNIQWFPGHMAKAKRQIQEQLKQIDVVLELIDSRIPFSSRNPMIDDITQHKQRLILFNKKDLADPELTKQWVEKIKSTSKSPILLINALTGQGTQEIEKIASQLMHNKPKEATRFNTIKLIIVGIPNVGKSALINRLANRKIAAVADRPAVTKRQQWIPIGSTLTLLDTPGILWPKFEDQTVGLNLAVTGAIKDVLLHKEDVAFHLLNILTQNYPNALKKKYNLSSLNKNPVSLMQQIAIARGCIQLKEEINFEKTYDVLLQDFRKGKLGLITLETPLP